MRLLRVKGSPVHVSTPFRAGHQARYPTSYPPALREEFPVVRPAVSCCLSAAGVRFLDTLSCQTGFRPPCGRPTAGPRLPAHVLRTLAGFTRSARVRPGPGWALSLPRGQRCSLAIALSVAAACRLTSAGPYSPRNRNPTRDVDLSRHQQEFPGSRPMPVLPLTCSRHGRVGDPWVFPRASNPTDQEPATHVAVGTGRTQTCSYVFDIRRTSSTSSLITCDLASQ